MAFNNGFPATYPQYYPYQQPTQQLQQPLQQNLTPPTIYANIIQIDDEAAVDRFPLAAGVSQMFITKAEDKIIIKTMGQTGAMPLKVFVERPPEPPKPEFDPNNYVTREELEKRLESFNKPVRRTNKEKEDAE